MDIQQTANDADRKNMVQRAFAYITSIPGRFKTFVVDTAREAKKIGKDDPRKIVHSFKVALALTLVSFLYYFRPLYDGFGQAGMWAVLTVVVVFEFTVGGTLSKCVNRGCATFAAGCLGIGAEYLADLCGEKGESVVLGILVFLLAAVSTFTRFFPNVKRRYDYGMLIFILTFSLVAVSGARVDEILELAHQRLSTILIGAATCVMISLSICPVWAGLDLHILIASNLEKLAVFLEGFGNELQMNHNGVDKSFLQSHKSVLNSKATEETLANLAWWEPCHGRFKFHHPWKQYLKIGTQARECAYLIQTLIGYKTSISSAFNGSSELQVKVQQLCIKICTESGKLLRELSSATKAMAAPSPPSDSTHVQNYRAAIDDLKSTLESSSFPTKDNAALQEILPLLVVASVLIDIIGCVDKIAMSVHELAQKACFKKSKDSTPLAAAAIIVTTKSKQHSRIVKPVNENDDEDYVVIEIENPQRVVSPPEKKSAGQGSGAGN